MTREDKRSLKGCAAATAASILVITAIARCGDFGADGSVAPTVRPTDTATVAPVNPGTTTEAPKVEPSTQTPQESRQRSVTATAATPITPSDATMKWGLQAAPTTATPATTNPDTRSRVITSVPTTPTKTEAETEPASTEGENMTEEIAPEVTPEEQAPIVATPAPADPCETDTYCGYDVNVPELTDSSVGPAAVVGDNYGHTSYNQGTIVNNYGEVAYNVGTIVNNYGTVHWNSIGPAGGVVGWETIVNNYGTVHHNGTLTESATIENNYGEVLGNQGYIENDYTEETD